MKCAHGYEINPARITSDFELALINATGTVFPSADHRGCLFHFRMALYRSIQRFGLQSRYLLEPKFALKLNYLSALAFVPIKDVRNVYDKFLKRFVVKNDRDFRSIQNYLKYFERTWVGQIGRDGQRKKPRFALKLWNWRGAILKGYPCTNNNVESWHNSIRHSIKKNPSIAEFIEFSKNESKYSIMRIDQYNSNGAGTEAKRMTVSQKLQRIVRRYDVYEDKITYLRYVAKLLQRH